MGSLYDLPHKAETLGNPGRSRPGLWDATSWVVYLWVLSARAESKDWFTVRKQFFVHNMSPLLPFLALLQRWPLTTDSPLSVPQNTIRVDLPSLGKVIGMACRSSWSSRKNAQECFTLQSTYLGKPWHGKKCLGETFKSWPPVQLHLVHPSPGRMLYLGCNSPSALTVLVWPSYKKLQFLLDTWTYGKWTGNKLSVTVNISI